MTSREIFDLVKDVDRKAWPVESRDFDIFTDRELELLFVAALSGWLLHRWTMLCVSELPCKEGYEVSHDLEFWRAPTILAALAAAVKGTSK